MKNSSKKKKLLAVAAALAIIAVLSGTFAWLTAQDQRINRAESAAVTKDAVKLMENWEPKALIPGTSAKKEVWVTNTGKNNVFVRVSFEEVLKRLASEGDITYDANGKATGFNPDENNIGVDVPVEVDVTDLVNNDGYEEVTGVVTNLPADCIMYAKGGKVIDPITSEPFYNDEYQIVHQYTNGKYQEVTATISKTESASNNAKDWAFTLSDIEYGYYANGFVYNVANWATSTLPDEDNNVSGYSLLGTEGNRYGVDYNYEPTANGLGAGFTLPMNPGLIGTAATDQYPIAGSANVNKGVQADKVSIDKTDIRIQYGADMLSDTSALVDGKWVYNSEDGWFYYTQPLASGASTPHLMDKLIFQSTMGKEYTKASYDLVVKMEAIQATPEALTDNAGWKFGTPAAGTPTKAILDKLTP
ncbi:hypothetical protein [Enterococcus sp. DIV0756]|uniref:hypothetical protein n=1 Tax=Enterococcus sp. DIV0756 TaxID=2774636 RepID=UPI003F285A15